MNYTALGTRIQTLRKQKRLTQEQLAELAEISPSFLGHIERGTRVASLDTLVAICNTLEISPEYLLYDSLVPAACATPTNATGQEVAQLRKLLQGAMDALDRLGTAPATANEENTLSDITLEAMELTYRSYVTLKRARLHTAADILSMMRSDLPAFMRLRGVGKKTIEEVLFTLRDMGVEVEDLIGRLGTK